MAGVDEMQRVVEGGGTDHVLALVACQDRGSPDGLGDQVVGRRWEVDAPEIREDQVVSKLARQKVYERC